MVIDDRVGGAHTYANFHIEKSMHSLELIAYMYALLMLKLQ